MKVLFICIGNVNRSRSAEAMLKAKHLRDVEVFSRGLLPSTVGRPISKEMFDLLSDEEKECVSNEAKLLKDEDLKEADIIYLMDNVIYQGLIRDYNRELYKDKLQFLSGRYDEPILDPYNTGDFETCYSHLKRCIDERFKEKN